MTDQYRVVSVALPAAEAAQLRKNIIERADIKPGALSIEAIE